MMKAEVIQQIAMARTLAECETDYPACQIMMACVKNAATDGRGYVPIGRKLMDEDTIQKLKRNNYRIFSDPDLDIYMIVYDSYSFEHGHVSGVEI